MNEDELNGLPAPPTTAPRNVSFVDVPGFFADKLTDGTYRITNVGIVSIITGLVVVAFLVVRK